MNVALTRARKRLFLSRAMVRTVYGDRRVSPPSEFIADIDEALVESADGDAEAAILFGIRAGDRATAALALAGLALGDEALEPGVPADLVVGVPVPLVDIDRGHHQ